MVPSYIISYRVEVIPMCKMEYIRSMGWEPTNDDNLLEAGYMVIDYSGFATWYPANVFENIATRSRG